MTGKSDQLLAEIVRHDIKSPLNVLQSAFNEDDPVDILGVEELEEDEKIQVREVTAFLRSAADKLDRMEDINSVKLESEYLSKFKDTEVDDRPGKYIREIAEMSEIIEEYINHSQDFSDETYELKSVLKPVERKGVVEYDGNEVSEVYGDVGLIMAANTIAMNAMDHGARGGVEPDLWAEIEELEEEYRIDIWDDGVGLPEIYEIDRIFDKGTGENSGLGLYIARELTELFDGSLEYSEENAEREDGFGLEWTLKKPGQYDTSESA